MPKFPGYENKAPGKDYEWRGGNIDENKGGWYNPKTKETLHWDMKHPEPYGPHWDYINKNGGWENGYRIFPNGSWERKIYDDMGGIING